MREASEASSASVRRGSGEGMGAEEFCDNTGNPSRRETTSQPATREGGAGPWRATERLGRAPKPGNAGGAKEPQFKNDDQRKESPEIFEADLPGEPYAYRPNRSAHDAIRAVHGLVNRGHREVVDADLSGSFDTIPHHELMKSVARRVSDGAMLRLLQQWLGMAVEETGEGGRKRRTTVHKDSGGGTPQGAPLPPLLANLYMRRFILGWKQQGWEKRLGAHSVNYADDFVILCRGSASEARERMHKIVSVLKRTVHETKTQTCRVPEESFDFLGYTIGRCHSKQTGRSCLGTRPARKRVKRICEEISEATRRSTRGGKTGELVAGLNRPLRGWANYFCPGPVSSADGAVDSHARWRLRQWLRHKHKKVGAGTGAYPDKYLYEKLGLLRLEKLTANLPWAKA